MSQFITIIAVRTIPAVATTLGTVIIEADVTFRAIVVNQAGTNADIVYADLAQRTVEFVLAPWNTLEQDWITVCTRQALLTSAAAFYALIVLTYETQPQTISILATTKSTLIVEADLPGWTIGIVFTPGHAVEINTLVTAWTIQIGNTGYTVVGIQVAHLPGRAVAITCALMPTQTVTTA